MDWNEYVKEAKKTITFDSREKLLFCTTAGLVGELVEYCYASDEATEEDLMKELGDLMWYTAVLSDTLDLKLVPTSFTVDKLNEDFEQNGVGSKYDSSMFHKEAIFTVGRIAETLKKCVRETDWRVEGTRKELIKYEMNFLLSLIQLECEYHNWNFSSVLLKNITKLADRQKRGVLMGDGDSR